MTNLSVTLTPELRLEQALKDAGIENPASVIGSHAFRGCTGLTSLDISRSLWSLGDCAFSYCIGLTSVDIPKPAFGYDAFRGCSALTTINILKHV
jgi:hypothetical protein